MISGAPEIFIRLIAAQKIHRFAAFGQSAFDRMSDQKRSRAERFVLGIESGEVTIGAPPVCESVNGAGDALPYIEDVKTQHFSLEKRSRGLEMKLLQLCISENSGLAALGPASTVQQEKFAE